MSAEKLYPKGYEPIHHVSEKENIRSQLLNAILVDHSKEDEESLDTDIFNVMSRRRSTRKFESTPIEEWKIEKILAAADTAPTAGNFQGFEIFHVKDAKMKESLAKAANNQPYVNVPLVLVYCKNPERVKLDFPATTLKKFAIQDATLAAAYSQLAATALGLSSIWIGMIDEKKVSKIIGTKLIPSSILCIGYPTKKNFQNQEETCLSSFMYWARNYANMIDTSNYVCNNGLPCYFALLHPWELQMHSFMKKQIPIKAMARHGTAPNLVVMVLVSAFAIPAYENPNLKNGMKFIYPIEEFQ